MKEAEFVRTSLVGLGAALEEADAVSSKSEEGCGISDRLDGFHCVLGMKRKKKKKRKEKGFVGQLLKNGADAIFAAGQRDKAIGGEDERKGARSSTSRAKHSKETDGEEGWGGARDLTGHSKKEERTRRFEGERERPKREETTKRKR